MLLAAFSKENGALLPVFIAVLELTILAKWESGDLFKWWRRLAIWLPSAMIVLYLLYIPRWQGGYEFREFSLYERVLTEPVVLWDYLQSVFTLQVYKLGLFQDDFPIYSSLGNPKVLLAILGHTLVIALAFTFRSRFQLFAFGVLWFYAGHLIESTTVALEIYFEHRNYLPLVGLSFSFMAILGIVFQKVSNEFSRFYYVFAPLLLVITGAITWGSLENGVTKTELFQSGLRSTLIHQGLSERLHNTLRTAVFRMQRWTISIFHTKHSAMISAYLLYPQAFRVLMTGSFGSIPRF